jgi:protein SCO1/2
MIRIVFAGLALAMVVACSGESTRKESTPSPAAAVESKGYPAAGTVKALNPKAPSIEIDHGDIEGLMPAMQMEFEVTDSALLNGLAVNDRIDFVVENGTTGMKVTAIKRK